jgi:hypothetical protein
MIRRTLLAALALSFAASALPLRAADGSVFMWKAEKDGTTVYLLGSIHALKADAYPLPEAIEKAFNEVDVVAFEVDLEEMNAAALQMLSVGVLDDGRSLEEVVGPATWAELVAAMEQTGLDASMVRFMKPWMAALSVASLELVNAGYLPSAGLDAHLDQRAKEAGKERAAFETAEVQVNFFANLTEAESLAFLRYTLADLETMIPLLDDLYRRWRVGDASVVEELLAKEFAEFPELYRKLVTDRNRAWLPEVEALLAGDRDAMVVVGSLHLVGSEGLVELLRKRGYTVSQM